MKHLALLLAAALLLNACIYSETPYQRVGIVDWPVQSQTTINKTVTVNAPPGSTVIYQEAQPVGEYAYPVYPHPVYHYSH